MVEALESMDDLTKNAEQAETLAHASMADARKGSFEVEHNHRGTIMLESSQPGVELHIKNVG